MLLEVFMYNLSYSGNKCQLSHSENTIKHLLVSHQMNYDNAYTYIYVLRLDKMSFRCNHSIECFLQVILEEAITT